MDKHLWRTLHQLGIWLKKKKTFEYMMDHCCQFYTQLKQLCLLPLWYILTLFSFDLARHNDSQKNLLQSQAGLYQEV